MTVAWNPGLRSCGDAQIASDMALLQLNRQALRAVKVDSVKVLLFALAEFGISPNDFFSSRRADELVKARALFVWALRTIGRPASYPELAGLLEKRDHSTAINLHQKAILLRLADPTFAAACRRLLTAFATNPEATHAC